MARPKKCRRICAYPNNTGFSPNTKSTQQVVLTLDEYETVRLLDYEGMTQEQCAQQMNVARATVTIIYDSARKKIADAFVNGKQILFQGGEYLICDYGNECCGECGKKNCDICENKNCKR